MRKLISSFFISLDGVVESPDKWHFPYFNEEMGDAVGGAIGATDAMLLGRRGYEEWAAYWPNQDPACSRRFPMPRMRSRRRSCAPGAGSAAPGPAVRAAGRALRPATRRSGDPACPG